MTRPMTPWVLLTVLVALANLAALTGHYERLSYVEDEINLTVRITGTITTDHLLFALGLALVMAGGLWVSRHLHPFVDRGWLRPGVLAVSTGVIEPPPGRPGRGS